MKTDTRLWCVRGAFCLSSPAGDIESTQSQMIERMAELLDSLFRANDLHIDFCVSILFTQTADITEMNAAAAAREASSDNGFSHIPLLCSQEPEYPGSLPRTIRLMISYYQSTIHTPTPIYLHGADVLRKDLFHDS